MAFKFNTASSSVWPPLRKKIAGTAMGTVLRNAFSVYSATIYDNDDVWANMFGKNIYF